MSSGVSGDIPRMTPSQVRSGDLVIRRADLREHPELDEATLVAKLGELGLPPSMVTKLKNRHEGVELTDYDPETDPLGKKPWSDFDDFLGSTDMTVSMQTRLKAELAMIHNSAIGRDGPYTTRTETNKPLLHSISSGEPMGYRNSIGIRYDDMEDVAIDVDALAEYLRNDDLKRFSGVGPGITAGYTEYVNAKIAELPGPGTA